MNTATLQLRGCNMIDAIRFAKVGFPEHLTYAEFRQRFECLLPDAKIE